MLLNSSPKCFEIFDLVLYPISIADINQVKHSIIIISRKSSAKHLIKFIIGMVNYIDNTEVKTCSHRY